MPRSFARRILSEGMRVLVVYAGFFGLIASTTVCPHCGQQTCPVGIAGAGALGAFMTGLMSLGRILLGQKRTASMKAHKDSGPDRE
jgi:hypothetical protein